MILYLLRRALYAIPIALAVGFVCFMLVQVAPGDPINAIVPPDAPADVVEQVRRDYGLDKPLPVQFGLWLLKVVQGDLGRSLATGRPVWSDLHTAIGNTLMLAFALAPSLSVAVAVMTRGPGVVKPKWMVRPIPSAPSTSEVHTMFAVKSLPSSQSLATAGIPTTSRSGGNRDPRSS